MFSEPEALDISRLREQMNTPQTTEKPVQKPFQKPLKDCKHLTFQPRNEKDIDRILRYFKEREEDCITATVPKDILIEAK